MKKYIFLTVNIQSKGEMQNYVRSKVEYYKKRAGRFIFCFKRVRIWEHFHGWMFLQMKD